MEQHSNTPQTATQVSNLIEEINSRRAVGWSVDGYIEQVQELARVVEALYQQWLSADPSTEELEGELFIVRPYISLCFLSNPTKRAAKLSPLSAKQKQRLVEYLVDEFVEVEEKNYLRAMLNVSITKFTTFLKNLEIQTIQ